MAIASSITRLLRRGDQGISHEAFSRLYATTHVVVFRYIYGLHGGSHAAVEDLTAETFLRAWNHRHRFTGNDEAVVGWLITIARRLVIDAIRRHKVRGNTVDLDEVVLISQQVGPGDHVIKREHIRTLFTLLQQLPDEQREMLVLRYMLNWPVNRIAAHVGKPENTVSVTMGRTLARLRRDWPHTDDEG